MAMWTAVAKGVKAAISYLPMHGIAFQQKLEMAIFPLHCTHKGLDSRAENLHQPT